MSHDIETILTAQKLRRPGAALDRRMAALLDEAPAALPFRTGPSRWRIVGVMLGTALAAGLMIALLVANPLNNSTPSAAPAVAVVPQPATVATATEDDEPVEITEVWSEMTPGDLVEVDGVTVRPYERQTVEHTQWIDEKNNVVIELTVPTRDVILATLQID